MASITKGPIGELDRSKWDGVSRTFTRDTSTGGVLTLRRVGTEVDVLSSYGGGVNLTHTTIASALTAIGTTNPVIIILAPGTWTISANVDWSAYTNVTFRIPSGALISHGAFTINIPNVDAGIYKIFSGTGAITLSGATPEAYPEWWGAKGDGTTDDSTSIQYAINTVGSSGGGMIYLSDRSYRINTGLVIANDYTKISGAGIGKTVILFYPTANATAFKFYKVASTLWNCGIYNLTMTGYTNYVKTGIDVYDARMFDIDHVLVGPDDLWTDPTFNSIALKTRGREMYSVNNCTFCGDYPVVIGTNANYPNIDIDHSTFFNTYLIGSTGAGRPLVLIEDGVNLTDLTFTGYQAWVRGTYGLYWVSTVPVLVSEGLSLQNVRHEGESSAAAYSIYIAHSAASYLQNLIIYRYYGGVTSKGIYLRGVNHTLINNVYYINPSSNEALNVDGTVYPLNLHACFWQTGTTLSSSGLTLLHGISTRGLPITPPSYGVFTNTEVPGGWEPRNVEMNGSMSGTPISLADNGTAKLCPETFMGMAFVSTNDTHSAIYEINGIGHEALEVADISTAYTPTATTDGFTNIYWSAANNRYEIENKRGAVRDYYITLIGHTVWYVGTPTGVVPPDPGPGVNFIAAWSNVSYDTFSATGADIISAIYTTSGTQSCNTGLFWITLGTSYTITATLTLTSGQAPTLNYMDAGHAHTTVLVNGVNTITFTSTGTQSLVAMSNTAASNWSCTFVFAET